VCRIKEWPRRCWNTPEPGPQKGLETVDTTRVHSHDHDDDTVEAHYASLEREPEACLCYDGWHFLGHVVELADGDEETEYIRVPCRRCNA
jgi:hypothetical protein